MKNIFLQSQLDESDHLVRRDIHEAGKWTASSTATTLIAIREMLIADILNSSNEILMHQYSIHGSYYTYNDQEVKKRKTLRRDGSRSNNAFQQQS